MLSLEFLTSFPSQIFPENGGIYPALIGSLWLLGLTGLISVPLGLGAAVYLEEYAQDTRINRMIEINISNLAGVPSVIYGLLGLGIFVELLAPVTGGGSVLTGALTLSLLILPVIIVATREALRAIPDSIREGGYALGATQWEVIWSHLLPRALPGALTGIILALSRAIGEAAPSWSSGSRCTRPTSPRARSTATWRCPPRYTIGSAARSRSSRTPPRPA